MTGDRTPPGQTGPTGSPEPTGVGSLDPDEAEVAQVIVSMYDALGDRPRFDAHLAPDITIWESDAPELLRGLPALDALRAARAHRSTTSRRPEWVRPEVIAVHRWGDAAVVRYLLRAHYGGDSADDVFRVTDVLRHGAGWTVVHHHAEQVEA